MFIYIYIYKACLLVRVESVGPEDDGIGPLRITGRKKKCGARKGSRYNIVAYLFDGQKKYVCINNNDRVSIKKHKFERSHYNMIL